MRPPNLAPFYACIYPGLCDIARGLGYALTVHGTMDHDFDLVAIPWTDQAVEDVVLVKAIKEHLGACYLHEDLAEAHNKACTIAMSEVDALILAALDERKHSLVQLGSVWTALEELRRKASMPERPYNLITEREHHDPTPKPHGRRAWNLHLDMGAKIDLSVMPRVI